MATLIAMLEADSLQGRINDHLPIPENLSAD
jgi:hypothetical protein